MYILLTGLWPDIPYEVKKGVGLPPRRSVKDINFVAANDEDFGHCDILFAFDSVPGLEFPDGSSLDILE